MTHFYRNFRCRIIGVLALYFCSLLGALMLATTMAMARADQPVKITQFSAEANGEYVTPSLPLSKLEIKNGRLMTTATLQNGRWIRQRPAVFNSYEPQSVVKTGSSQCNIIYLGWRAFLTTYYVVIGDENENSLYVMKACGKAPLNFNLELYGNQTANNFVNHAQMAASALHWPIDSSVKVIAAGEIDIMEGRIVYMDNCSGHFKPTVGATLAYMDQLTGSLTAPGPLTLTLPLYSDVASGSISSTSISKNFIQQKSGGSNDIPQRYYHSTTGYQTGVRAGTGGCYGYTTVFYPELISSSEVKLVGGLMMYKQGNPYVFQSSISTQSWQNLKSVYLDSNFGIYSYQAVADTDWHAHNNALSLQFTDETNDTYSLSLYIFSYNHEVDYNSAHPNIKEIYISRGF